jgi:hypothetical protein
MTDVKVPVWFGWEAGMHASIEFVGLQIVEDDVANKIRSIGGFALCRGSFIAG